MKSTAKNDMAVDQSQGTFKEMKQTRTIAINMQRGLIVYKCFLRLTEVTKCFGQGIGILVLINQLHGFCVKKGHLDHALFACPSCLPEVIVPLEV